MSPPILNNEDLKARIPVLAKYINEAEIVARNESSSKFEVVKALNRLTNYLAPMEKYSQVGAASPEVIQWYITAIHPTMFAANEVKSDLQSILQMIREAENKPKDAENTVLVTPQPHNEQVSIKEEVLKEVRSALKEVTSAIGTFKDEVKTSLDDVEVFKKSLAHIYVGEASNALLSVLRGLNSQEKINFYRSAGLSTSQIRVLNNEIWNNKANRNEVSHAGEVLLSNIDRNTLGNSLTMIGKDKNSSVFLKI